jgi:hypothetical protein
MNRLRERETTFAKPCAGSVAVEYRLSTISYTKE